MISAEHESALIPTQVDEYNLNGTEIFCIHQYGLKWTDINYGRGYKSIWINGIVNQGITGPKS